MAARYVLFALYLKNGIDGAHKVKEQTNAKRNLTISIQKNIFTCAVGIVDKIHFSEIKKVQYCSSIINSINILFINSRRNQFNLKLLWNV